MRSQFTSMAVNDQWQSRHHIKQLLPFVLNASKICDEQPMEVWQNKPVVYARFNLENKDLYIGQTNNWGDFVLKILSFGRCNSSFFSSVCSNYS